MAATATQTGRSLAIRTPLVLFQTFENWKLSLFNACYCQVLLLGSHVHFHLLHLNARQVTVGKSKNFAPQPER